MKNLRILVIFQVFLTVLAFLLGGLFMLIIVGIKPIDNNYNIVKDNTKVYEKSSLAKSIDKVYDAVVAVETYDGAVLSHTGTGFIYKVDNSSGYVLTNEHVLEESNNVKVVFSNEKEEEAKILGKDIYLDLAVLKIDKKYVNKIVSIGNSKKLHLGDTVFAIGSPLGTSYHGSVTSGIVSGKNRLVTTTVTNNSKESDFVMSAIQTDAAINPGNSGGPLLNINSEVVGICTMKLIDDRIEGMGFATPIEYAMVNIDSLEKGEKITRPKLGITMKNATDSNLAINNIDLKDNNGVIITDIKEGTTIDKTELKVNDVIIKIDDTKIKNTAYLKYVLYQHKIGDTISITYIRDGKEKNIKVVLN